MTENPVPLDELLAAPQAMVKGIVSDMPDAHRRFLVSFALGMPDWAQLDVNGAADLPAIRWRQQNLDALDKTKRTELVARFKSLLLG